jgi:hypothetical protein
MVNLVTMALYAVLSGVDDFVTIADRAGAKKYWLARFLDLSARIPSLDRFDTTLGALRPATLGKCLPNLKSPGQQ